MIEGQPKLKLYQEAAIGVTAVVSTGVWMTLDAWKGIYEQEGNDCGSKIGRNRTLAYAFAPAVLAGILSFAQERRVGKAFRVGLAVAALDLAAFPAIHSNFLTRQDNSLNTL